jgi:hypothetical protein
MNKLFGVVLYVFGFVTLFAGLELLQPPGIFFQLFHVLFSFLFMFLGFSIITLENSQRQK